MKKFTHNQNQREGKVDENSPFFEVIQDAYRLFKQGRTEHAICDCCMNSRTREEFFNFPQEQLPLEYLNHWFGAAPELPMPKAAWRFVLPRIMEVLASGEDPSPCIGIEVSLSRFQTGNRDNWSKDEWEVLDKFQRLLLSNTNLRNEDCLDDVVCMFASASWSTEDLFSQVMELPTDQLVNKLWSDWCEHHHPSIWVTPFWKDESIPWRFYGSKALLEKVTNFSLEESTKPEMALKAMAVADTIFMKPTDSSH